MTEFLYHYKITVTKVVDGDTIYVEGYNEPFRVTVYENDTIKYLPFV